MVMRLLCYGCCSGTKRYIRAMVGFLMSVGLCSFKSDKKAQLHLILKTRSLHFIIFVSSPKCPSFIIVDKSLCGWRNLPLPLIGIGFRYLPKLKLLRRQVFVSHLFHLASPYLLFSWIFFKVSLYFFMVTLRYLDKTIEIQ